MRMAGLIIAIVSGVLTAIPLLIWALGFGFAGAAVGNLIHILIVVALIPGAIFVCGIVMFLVGGKRQGNN